jgi:uncharacterized membrane protein YbjE (DUF340 family)
MIKHIIAVLALGLAAGYLNSNWRILDSIWISNYIFNYSLFLLLFVMGLAFGMDRDSIAKAKQRGLRILIMPFAIACGSILGGIVGGLVLGISISGSAAVSAGFGWYTLAGPLVGQVLGAEWGALGFVVNFLRELLTIVAISLLVKIDKYGPIASGVATTMDTTLPVIVHYCGSDALILAFSSGFILSVISPFVIIAIALLK